MKKIIFITAFTLFFSFYYSQITFVKGYLVTLNNDTLRGEVKINPKKQFDTYNKVFFKDEAGLQKNYKPDKVKGYGFEGKHYVTSKYGDEILFYKVLSEGTIMLYEIMYEEMNMGNISYKSEYFIAVKSEKDFKRIKQNKFKKQLLDLMKDNPDIIQNAEDDKHFEIEKITELVNQYNNWAKSNNG